MGILGYIGVAFIISAVIRLLRAVILYCKEKRQANE